MVDRIDPADALGRGPRGVDAGADGSAHLPRSGAKRCADVRARSSNAARAAATSCSGEILVIPGLGAARLETRYGLVAGLVDFAMASASRTSTRLLPNRAERAIRRRCCAPVRRSAELLASASKIAGCHVEREARVGSIWRGVRSEPAHSARAPVEIGKLGQSKGQPAGVEACRLGSSTPAGRGDPASSYRCTRSRRCAHSRRRGMPPRLSAQNAELTCSRTDSAAGPTTRPR